MVAPNLQLPNRRSRCQSIFFIWSSSKMIPSSLSIAQTDGLTHSNNRYVTVGSIGCRLGLYAHGLTYAMLAASAVQIFVHI